MEKQLQLAAEAEQSPDLRKEVQAEELVVALEGQEAEE
jgi:hypothetical protein